MEDIVKITYCVEWDFLPIASSLAASIDDKFGYTVELIEGYGGIFKVTLNEEGIFDNKNDFNKLPTKEVLFQEIEKLAWRW